MIETNEKILLDSLKNAFLKQNKGISKENFGPDDINQDKKEYYLKNIEDNCFQRKKRHDLKSDSRALRSSATMIYNTLGEKKDEIFFKNLNQQYLIYDYEEILPGLKDRTGPHLDVTLKTQDESKVIFIESKCLEWLSTAEKMVNSYLKHENYKYDNSDIFIPWFKKFLETPEEEQSEYSSIYSRYNSKQMNIHLFGIYNWCLKETKLPKEIKLWNIVWDYSDIEEYKTEKQEGIEYCKLANEEFAARFQKKFNINFSVEYIEYSDFLNIIDWTKKQERRNYLKRYEPKIGLSNSEFLEKYDDLWNETWHHGDSVIESTNTEWPYQNTTDDKISSKEKWKSLENIEGYTEYKVSNLGRVKFKGKIIPQGDIKQKGYLRLDPEGNYHVDHQVYVYTLVAIGFLGKRFNDGYDVHHRNNNGYDCSVENLMLLTRIQHNAVHCKENSKNYYKDILKNELE